MLNGEKRKIDVEKEEAAEIIAVNTFKEIKGMKESLGKLATAISTKEDPKIAEAIKESAKSQNAVAEAQNALTSAIKELQKPDANLKINNDNFLTSFNKIADRICESNEKNQKSNEKIAEALENKLMVDEFNFTYDYGNIKTAKVIYKPMSQITVSKSKYQA